jgi:O-acetyl-ADP-ribose deacetylase (regulator of RNase III)
MDKTLRETKLLPGLSLQLIQGDIIKADVEAIVNPANQWLAHGGGLAGLIASQAGPEFENESDDWVADHGQVRHDSPAFTGAGNLPFKFIIHAVGPVWGSGSENTKLTEAVSGALRTANQLNLKSLALPAISTGVFAYPLEEASEVILSAIRTYSKSNNSGSLKNIQLFVYDSRAAAVFSATWDRLFR